MTNPSEHICQSFNVDEIKDIEARAERVSTLLRKSATLWLEIAKEVFDAKSNLSSDAYKVFLQKSCLTPAIADKMPTIAKSPELYTEEAKKHVHRLEGWSTLYEAGKLTSDEKKEFFDALDKDPEADVSRAFIKSFKKSNSPSKPADIQIADIRINEDDINRLDYNLFIDLQSKIDEISRIIDRMPQLVTLTINNKSMTNIENKILDQDTNTTAEIDEHCDEELPITVPAANADCSISEVAY